MIWVHAVNKVTEDPHQHCPVVKRATPFVAGIFEELGPMQNKDLSASLMEACPYSIPVFDYL